MRREPARPLRLDPEVKKQLNDSGNEVCRPSPLIVALRDVRAERPSHECVRVSVTHPILGLQVVDDL